MDIRTATLHDSGSVFALLRTMPELATHDTADPAFSEAFIHECITDTQHNLVLVAQEAGSIRGALLAEIWKAKHYSFLIAIGVDHTYRSRGIATSLITRYESICTQLGLTRIIGLIRKDNALMQAFCETRGYLRGNALYPYEKQL